jgi:hypothetical protein
MATNSQVNGTTTLKTERGIIKTQMARGLRVNGYKVKSLTREQYILLIDNILWANTNKIYYMEMQLNMTLMVQFCQNQRGNMVPAPECNIIIKTIKLDKKVVLKIKMQCEKMLVV